MSEKRCRTVFVFDAGGLLSPEPDQVVRSLKDGRRGGAYVGIRSDIRKYKVGDCLDAAPEATTELAEIDRGLPAPTGYPYARGVS